MTASKTEEAPFSSCVLPRVCLLGGGLKLIILRSLPGCFAAGWLSVHAGLMACRVQFFSSVLGSHFQARFLRVWQVNRMVGVTTMIFADQLRGTGLLTSWLRSMVSDLRIYSTSRFSEILLTEKQQATSAFQGYTARAKINFRDPGLCIALYARKIGELMKSSWACRVHKLGQMSSLTPWT